MCAVLAALPQAYRPRCGAHHHHRHARCRGWPQRTHPAQRVGSRQGGGQREGSHVLLAAGQTQLPHPWHLWCSPPVQFMHTIGHVLLPLALCESLEEQAGQRCRLSCYCQLWFVRWHAPWNTVTMCARIHAFCCSIGGVVAAAQHTAGKPCFGCIAAAHPC